MEKIYSNTNPEVLLHIINRKKEITSQRVDLSPEEEYLQVACFNLAKGNSVKPHKHMGQLRTIDITQESWLVIEGKIKIVIYDINDKRIREEILDKGDCLVTFRGGHEFIVLEDNTIIYEFKNGPYFGEEKDKVLIERRE